MNIEQQVCSIEYGKRLKELGIKQESYFYYSNEKIIPLLTKEQFIFHLKNKININIPSMESYSAFTVAELLNLIPLINGCPFQLLKGFNFGDTNPKYAGRFDTLSMHYECLEKLPDYNPANACAKMLIYLLENGLIKND